MDTCADTRRFWRTWAGLLDPSDLAVTTASGGHHVVPLISRNRHADGDEERSPDTSERGLVGMASIVLTTASFDSA